jgi:hypothetical protein
VRVNTAKTGFLQVILQVINFSLERGGVSASVSLEGKIDYAAGQTAKQQWLKKLDASNR